MLEKIVTYLFNNEKILYFFLGIGSALLFVSGVLWLIGGKGALW
jgi:hypothetical protein